MQGANGRDRRATASNNALETISAAATAIASAADNNRVPQATASARKRRWWSRWSVYWCFGSYKHQKRIGHAVLVPEPVAPATNDPAPGYPARTSVIALPFVAPPSSPASFLQSEPPSATQSPVGLVCLNSMPTNMFSPIARPSIFAIGPYAHETQLVSPPVFSTFTTEPSTAPFTPPPESVHLTTPSSPEVPFAQLLNPNFHNSEVGQRSLVFENYEFQFYQLPPGSPLGQLISPSSGVSGSGAASPFPDGEIAILSPRFPQFQMRDPPKLLSLDKLCSHGRGSFGGSRTFTPDTVKSTTCDGISLDHQSSNNTPYPEFDTGCHGARILDDHRISSDLNAEDTARCVERKFKISSEATTLRQENSSDMVYDKCKCPSETSNKAPAKAEENEKASPKHNEHQSISIGSTKEFNFENMGRIDNKLITVSDTEADEKVAAKEDGVLRNWLFFPVVQAGIS